MELLDLLVTQPPRLGLTVSSAHNATHSIDNAVKHLRKVPDTDCRSTIVFAAVLKLQMASNQEYPDAHLSSHPPAGP